MRLIAMADTQKLYVCKIIRRIILPAIASEEYFDLGISAVSSVLALQTLQ